MTASAKLIVPVNVAALCVGDADAQQAAGHFGDIAADFSRMPYVDANGNTQNAGANIATAVLPTPLQFAQNPPARGIHLHWALPDALTHGSTDGSQKLKFRTVPNRWLVVRTVGNWSDPANPSSSVAAWVIESDQLWDGTMPPGSDAALAAQNAQSRAIPWSAADGAWPTPYAFLGRVYRLADWREGSGTHYMREFTAVGYGTPEFAAAYPHCPNVFGFYDPATDLSGSALGAASSLSYTVIGWYADPTKDPLAQFVFPADAKTIAEKIAALQTAFGWTMDANAATAAGMPTGIVCNGLIRGIAWNPATSYLQTFDGKGIELAVGNTTTEAVSALLARRHSDIHGVETLLNLFQLGFLPGIGQPGAAADADEGLHQAGFGTRKGGTVWSVVRRTAANAGDGKKVNLSDADVLAAAAAAPALSAATAALLNQLNLAQQSADAQRFAFESRQRQLFADWYKYMMAEYDQLPGLGDFSTDAAFAFLCDEVTALLALDSTADSGTVAGVVALREYALSQNPAATPPAGISAAIAGGLLGALIKQRSAVAAAFAQLQKEVGAGFMIVPTDAPRYWQPNDPVLLLSGDAMRPSSRYGGDGAADASGFLRCRLSSQIVATLTTSGVGVGAPGLPALPAPLPPTIPADTTALVAEASLIDPDRATLIAAALTRRNGGKLPGSAPLAGFVASLQAAQTAFLQGTSTAGFVFAGSPPSSIGVTAWAKPWIPLLLQWEVEVHPLLTVGYPLDPTAKPVAVAYPAGIVSHNYALDDDEVELRPNAGRRFADAALYSGSLVLAASAEIDLAAQIDKYLQSHTGDPFAAELKEIAANLDLSAMAQTLSGFNEALQMRAQTLQLRVGDPLAVGMIAPAYGSLLFAAAIGRQTGSAPQPDQPFGPLRAGQWRISRLRVLDAFGQIRDLVDLARIDGSVANPVPAIADRLAPPQVDIADPEMMELPPRLVQPSRLLFRWLAADDDLAETNSHPASSPIFGWVLFNRLDDALMVYDADGNALGSFNVTGQVWQDAPGAGDPSGDPIARAKAALQGANPHLQAFVLGILQRAQPQAFLASMLDAIDLQMSAINPLGFKQDQGLSLLIGQPLALARASVRLEVKGLKALDESWAAFEAAIAAGGATKPDSFRSRADGGVGNITFPLRLGDLGLLEDGLVGYFTGDDIDAGAPAAYATFYASAMNPALGTAAAPPDPTHGVVAPDPAAIALSLNDADTDVGSRILSLLLDPRGSVHATTGVLPVKAISIPDDMYSEALARMAVTFLSTPVLKSPASFPAPLPRERGYDWSWVTPDAGGATWSQSAVRGPVNPAALPDPAQRIEEGWLRLTKSSPQAKS